MDRARTGSEVRQWGCGLRGIAWYVLRTKTGQEQMVSTYLTDRTVQSYLPMFERAKPTRAGRKSVPFFPSYLFVRVLIPSHKYVEIRSAPGVVGIVSFDGVPAIVPDGVVETIRERVDLENRVRYPSPFKVGERVVITDGPFKDIEAIFDGKLTATGRAQLLIEWLNKQWRVRVSVKQIRKAG